MNNASKGRCVTITPSGIALEVSGAGEAMSNPEEGGQQARAWPAALSCRWTKAVDAACPSLERSGYAPGGSYDEIVPPFHFVVLGYPVPIGALHLTLGGALQLAALCALVVIAERLLRRKVVMRVLGRTHIDAGLQYAIARISGYVIIVFGFYLALNAVGVNLNSLAVVAGAIGIGIGFGLQNVIQNFISGLIILAERPISIGDRVEVGGVKGTVSTISLRSTAITSTDNITTIVPNSNFIINPVTNWSHGDPKVRIRIPFGVAYGTDIEKLKRVANEVAVGCPDALKDPPPHLFFVSFGDSALNFELGVWTVSMTHAPRRFISDINFGLERKLRENGIVMPFPQREITFPGGPPPART